MKQNVAVVFDCVIRVCLRFFYYNSSLSEFAMIFFSLILIRKVRS